MKRMILEARINEYATRDETPHVRWTPDEIAEAAARCREAGASIVHFHAKEPDGSPEHSVEDASAWAAHLARLGIDTLAVTPDPVQVATEGALWGAICHHGLLTEAVIVFDGAGQFRVGTHALCWVHAERLVHKLVPATPEQRRAVEVTRTLIWWLGVGVKAGQGRKRARNGWTGSHGSRLFWTWVEAEFPAHVRERRRIDEATVGHHRPQRHKARLGEEQARWPGRRLEAHQPALEQALGDQRHLGLARLRAAAPGPELETVSNTWQGREEPIKLAAYVVPLAGRERGGACDGADAVMAGSV